MTKLYFYNNTSSNNTIPKDTIYLGEKDVDVMPNSSVIRPRFLLSGGFNALTYNYVYCEEFQRYYFVDDIITKGNNMYELVCSVDVLETYKNQILGNSLIIERQEKYFNPMLVDNEIISQVGTQTIKKVIGNVGKVPSYILTVTGGSE